MNKKIYGLICYLVLMQDLDSVAPSYMLEKTYLMELEENAFAALDFKNMLVAISWCKGWKVPVPKDWQMAYDGELAAMKELEGRGFKL